MATCKEGKVKNANNRCVKIKSLCKKGKSKNANGRCVKNSSIKKTMKKRRPNSSSMYKKPLPIPAGKFRGLLLTKKRHLKHLTTPKTSTSSEYGHFKF